MAAGAGLDRRHEKGSAHTQGVLNVDQPAIEAQKLSHEDQPIRHRLVRAIVPPQEGLAQLSAFFPLGDEGACGAGEQEVGCGDVPF